MIKTLDILPDVVIHELVKAVKRNSLLKFTEKLFINERDILYGSCCLVVKEQGQYGGYIGGCIYRVVDKGIYDNLLGDSVKVGAVLWKPDAVKEELIRMGVFCNGNKSEDLH